MKKHVVVTGHKSGIGERIGEILSYLNYSVWGFDGDVSKRDEWENNLCRFKNRQNKDTYLWAIINCAGIAQAKPIMDVYWSRMEDMFRVNCLSILHSIQTFGQYMIDNFKSIAKPDEGFNGKFDSRKIIGHIVNITSLSALQGMSGHAHYCASKFAANGLSQVAAKELAKYGILVNCVCPGPTHTKMWAQLDKEYSEINNWPPDKPESEKYYGKNLIKRLGEPEDVANVVGFLISDKNTYITGSNIKVSGGNILG